MCMGDFNKIISLEEKFGKAFRPYKQMKVFREVLEECELSDLGYKGYKYTWCNNMEGIEFTKDRLGKVLGNSDWHSLYDLIDIYILPVQSLDHYHLLISCPNQERDFMCTRKIFRYEASWARREECKDVMKKAWGWAVMPQGGTRRAGDLGMHG
ncbi:hypothetical protein I3842_16G043300 [Carya illinoinensis]|uniref:Uncharacterized protein n=1 Tax=Carya illinoinensis TaxID=32201 RepID=A0A921ZZX0_CARIL|nr:hypothetical protein I3842_16G043300 [Carya illinoinensis]